LRVVLSPEYEDPDRDNGEQTDPSDQPPTPLYGAEDVLNAQGWSSALKHRGARPAVPHLMHITTALNAANLASRPN